MRSLAKNLLNPNYQRFYVAPDSGWIKKAGIQVVNFAQFALSLHSLSGMENSYVNLRSKSVFYLKFQERLMDKDNRLTTRHTKSRMRYGQNRATGIGRLGHLATVAGLVALGMTLPEVGLSIVAALAAIKLISNAFYGQAEIIDLAAKNDTMAEKFRQLQAGNPQYPITMFDLNQESKDIEKITGDYNLDCGKGISLFAYLILNAESSKPVQAGGYFQPHVPVSAHKHYAKVDQNWSMVRDIESSIVNDIAYFLGCCSYEKKNESGTLFITKYHDHRYDFASEDGRSAIERSRTWLSFLYGDYVKVDYTKPAAAQAAQ